MEHRTDLEDLLLAGLSEEEREEVRQAMDGATARKLDRLRRQRDDCDVIDLTDQP